MELNENQNTVYQTLWGAAKVVSRRKLIAPRHKSTAKCRSCPWWEHPPRHGKTVEQEWPPVERQPLAQHPLWQCPGCQEHFIREQLGLAAKVPLSPRPRPPQRPWPWRHRAWLLCWPVRGSPRTAGLHVPFSQHSPTSALKFRRPAGKWRTTKE